MALTNKYDICKAVTGSHNIFAQTEKDLFNHYQTLYGFYGFNIILGVYHEPYHLSYNINTDSFVAHMVLHDRQTRCCNMHCHDRMIVR